MGRMQGREGGPPFACRTPGEGMGFDNKDEEAGHLGSRRGGKETSRLC